MELAFRAQHVSGEGLLAGDFARASTTQQVLAVQVGGGGL